MREPTDLEKKQYQRFKEILDLSHQRYLDAGGDPRRTHSGLPGEDYLSETERAEAISLMRQLAGISIVGDEVRCQGRVWKKPVNRTKQEDKATSQSAKR